MEVKRIKNYCVFLHDWNKWQETLRESIVSSGSIITPMEPYKAGTAVLMERECERCGLKELHYKKVTV